MLARFSKAYDVLNNIAIDAYLTKRTDGEQFLAEKHLEYLGKGDLIILDRGYPSFYLFRKMLENECDFCCRLTVNNWNVAKEIVASDQKESIIELKPGKTLTKQLYAMNVDPSPIKLRLIKIRLNTGEDEVLITSILNLNINHSCFESLYQMRWGVEESFKVDKHQLRMEDFSGYTVQSIMQEFNAMILLSNLSMVFSYNRIKEVKSKKWKYKISVTTAISKFRENIVSIFKNIGNIDVIEKLIKSIRKNMIPIRDGRTFERNVYRRRRYHYQYKNL